MTGVNDRTRALNAVCPYYTMYPLEFPLRRRDYRTGGRGFQGLPRAGELQAERACECAIAERAAPPAARRGGWAGLARPGPARTGAR